VGARARRGRRQRVRRRLAGVRRRLAADELATVAVQVGGKTRGTVRLARDAAQEAAVAAAMAEPAVARFVTGDVRKVV
jgi:leucyl-tRNA synthetase